MYRNTEHAMNYAAKQSPSKACLLSVFNVGVTEASFILPSLWTKRGVLLLLQPMSVKCFRLWSNFVDGKFEECTPESGRIFGSYAWSGGAKAEFDNYAQQMAWDVLGHVEFIGSPKAEDIDKIIELSTQIALKVKS